MQNRMQWVLSGTMIATAVAIAACQRAVEDPRIASKMADTVTITANCAAGNQIDVKVNKWVLYMKRQGDVLFVPLSTTGAAISLTEETPAQWPFDATPPLDGNAEGKVKNKGGEFRYNVRVACSRGAPGDSVRVVIDPDIIVN